MTFAIASIQEDHHRFGALLSCFQKVANGADRLKPSDITLMEAMVEYIESFLDRFHHPKEDEYLFRLLRKRAPEAETLLNTLRDQHYFGRKKLEILKAALKDIGKDGPDGVRRLQAALKDYVEFERHHVFVEEKEFIPLAWEKLTPADWEEANAAFGANEDPLFSRNRQQRFDVLFSAIEMMAPPPYGRGIEVL